MRAANGARASATIVKLIAAITVTGALVAGVMLPEIGGVGLAAKTQADRFLNTTCTLNEKASPTAKTTLLASDGKTVIAQLFAQNRTPVQLSQIPVLMQKALIDTEDRRFYKHHGVDIRGVLRAAAHNNIGGRTQGGSTLTMQYVKQLRYYLAKNNAERAAAIAVTISRKIEDAKCAIDLERRESKAQILQNYFNIAFFGQNSYGVQSAAATYFGKDVSQLTVPQEAVIVGLVQSPTAYNPFINPSAALQRRNVVIEDMVTAGDLTTGQGKAAKAAPLGLVATTPAPVAEGCAYANPAVVNVGFFCDYAVAWLNSHGLDMATLRRGGYTIKTTLDAGLQTSGQNAVYARGIAPNSPMTLIMPSVDPRTGNVTTMISSRQYGVDPNNPTQTSVPLFTDAYAGAGSTFKYFTAITALRAGLTPSFTMTAGAPYFLKNCPRPVGRPPYVARNAGNYAPTLRFGQALPQSVNTWFVGLEDMFFNCDVTPIVDTAKSLAMHRVAASVLREAGRADEASDAVSEAIVSLMTSMPTDVVNWEAFLVTAARRKAIDRLRSAAVRHSHPEPVDALPDVADDVDIADDMAERMDRHRQAAVARASLSVLEERDRYVVWQMAALERPRTELADELGVSPARVSQLVTRSLRQLRERLTGKEGKDE